MKRLIILGNGFDLFHGLKTKYKDFLEYLEGNYNTTYFKLMTYFSEEELWRSFERALGQIDYEVLEDENLMYLDLEGDEYVENLSNSLQFYNYISKYLKEWISKVNKEAKPMLSREYINNENRYLTFNYTNLLESIYGIDPKNILYIHGNVARNEALIVGHKNKLDFMSSNVDYLDSRVQKGKQLIENTIMGLYKDTRTIIKNNNDFFESLAEIQEVYVLGHSLSRIDIDYFKEIMINISNCKWYFTYKDEEDKEKKKMALQGLDLEGYELITFKDLL